MDKKTPKRLVIDVPDDLHARIKTRCAIRRMKIKDYVIHAIVKALLEDEKYD